MLLANLLNGEHPATEEPSPEPANARATVTCATICILWHCEYEHALEFYLRPAQKEKKQRKQQTTPRFPRAALRPRTANPTGASYLRELVW
jgi:hypothetical protein